MPELRYRFRPLGPWTGPATPAGSRRNATFKATYPATLALVFREAEKLGARELVLQVDISDRWIRTDGLPAANARFGSHPGVVVSFESRYGPLRYATDAFTEWRDNLRAIALSLEALRAVDRYGVSKRGEQYTGWKALPAGTGAAFGSADDAEQWMRQVALERFQIEADRDRPTAIYHALARRMHPDTGGDRGEWDRLDAARQLLVTAGRL
ncbi:MAG: hypothetical protein ACRDOL_22555 [Streptosporangiaceae bacterium]